MTNTPRTGPERKADTLATLQTQGIDVWVATASASNDASPRAHLVPLSLAWIDERVVIALESDSLTSRNITQHRHARLAIGATRDVVVIDAVLEHAWLLPEVPAALAEGYASQADWDPRRAAGAFVYLVMRPERVMAWREVNEIAGRTLMRDGTWVV